MTTILFRAKSKENGEWYSGHYLQLADSHFIIPNLELSNMTEIDPKTLCRFTGLLDKDNNKVFEGDLLQFGEHILAVYYDGERFQWMAKEAVEHSFREYPRKDWYYIELGWIAAEVACVGMMKTSIIGNIMTTLKCLL